MKNATLIADEKADTMMIPIFSTTIIRVLAAAISFGPLVNASTRPASIQPESPRSWAEAALEQASDADNRLVQSSIYQSVVHLFHELGHEDRAKAVVAQALKQAKRQEGKDAYIWLHTAFEASLKTHRWGLARKTIAQLENRTSEASRGDVSERYAELAKAQAFAGDLEPALKSLKRIAPGRERNLASTQLARTLAHEKRHNDARRVAGEMSSPQKRGKVLNELRVQSLLEKLKAVNAKGTDQLIGMVQNNRAIRRHMEPVMRALVEAGRADRALTLAKKLKDSKRRAFALRAVAASSAAWGKYVLARKAASAVNDQWRGSAFLSVAEAQARRGDIDAARKTVQSIASRYESKRAWAAIAVAHAKQNHPKQARQLLQEHFRSDDRLSPRYGVAVALARNGHYRQAGKVAKSLELGERSQAMESFVRALIEHKNLAKAGEYAADIAIARIRARTSLRVANAFYETNKPNQSRRMIRQAVKAAEEIEPRGEGVKAATFADIAAAQLRHDDREAGRKTLKKAIQLLDAIPTEFWAFNAYGSLAQAVSETMTPQQTISWLNKVENANVRALVMLATAAKLSGKSLNE